MTPRQPTRTNPSGATPGREHSELKRILADRPDVLLLDVRTDGVQDGHLPSAAFSIFRRRFHRRGPDPAAHPTHRLVLRRRSGVDAMKRLSAPGSPNSTTCAVDSTIGKMPGKRCPWTPGRLASGGMTHSS